MKGPNSILGDFLRVLKEREKNLKISTSDMSDWHIKVETHIGSVSELMKWFHDGSRRHIGVFEGLLEYFGVTDEDRWHWSQPQVTDGSIFLGQVIEQFRGVQPTT